MADPTEIQTVPTAADDDQHEIQMEPLKSEPNPSSPSNTPDQGDADPAPARVSGRRRFPKRGYFDVRDESKVEFWIEFFDILVFVASLAFFVTSFLVSEYHYFMAYNVLLTAWVFLRLFYKWYRVQGGFDTYSSLLGDFLPGTYSLIFSLWGYTRAVVLAVNLFSIVFDFVNLVIQYFPSYVKFLTKLNVQKFLRAKQFRDRYEDIGTSGLLPCNEATNEIQESTTRNGEYYTLKVDHDTPVSDVETPVSDVHTQVNDEETLAETLARLRKQKKIRWIIGTMMVSYSDNDYWVTIKQKAEERAVKTFMERFSPKQKLNFIEMMLAWEKQPSQGILKKIGRKRSHCFTLARLIDLTKQGFSLHTEKTNLQTIKVGAEVDTVVEDFIDSTWEVLKVVYNRVARQKAIIVAIIAVVVMFHMSPV